MEREIESMKILTGTELQQLFAEEHLLQIKKTDYQLLKDCLKSILMNSMDKLPLMYHYKIKQFSLKEGKEWFKSTKAIQKALLQWEESAMTWEGGGRDVFLLETKKNKYYINQARQLSQLLEMEPVWREPSAKVKSTSVTYGSFKYEPFL